MSWNKVFDYFIDVKHTIGENFNTKENFADLIDKYGTEKQIERKKWLRFAQYDNMLLIRYAKLADLPHNTEVSFWDLYDGMSANLVDGMVRYFYEDTEKFKGVRE